MFITNYTNFTYPYFEWTNNHTLEIELPGVTDHQISVTSNNLTLNGKDKRNRDIEYVFKIPSYINTNADIKAKLQNGILTIEFGEKRPKLIEIQRE